MQPLHSRLSSSRSLGHGWRAVAATAASTASLVVASALLPASAAEPAASDGPTTAPRAAANSVASGAREIKWSQLIPPGWDPSKEFLTRGKGITSDFDPRARRLLKEFRVVLDNAPTVASMDGSAVKLPGYVVPLETLDGGLKEFLLVPYFGACIHTPPPPANQIVYVKTDKPVPGFRSMDTVWISGTLRTTRQDTLAGSSGYTIEGAVVERYVGEPRP